MGHKILLVEDDPCFGSVLKSYLELSDYDVIHCTNGVDGPLVEDVLWDGSSDSSCI